MTEKSFIKETIYDVSKMSDEERKQRFNEQADDAVKLLKDDPDVISFLMVAMKEDSIGVVSAGMNAQDYRDALVQILERYKKLTNFLHETKDRENVN